MKKILSGDNEIKRSSLRRITIAVLLLLSVFVGSANSVRAEPKNDPNSCKGKGVPDGAFSCELTKGNKTICNGGVYMCCKPNAQGGYDCDQIEAKTSNPTKAFKFTAPVGVLQNAPVTTPPTKTPPTTVVPKTGGTLQAK